MSQNMEEVVEYELPPGVTRIAVYKDHVRACVPPVARHLSSGIDWTPDNVAAFNAWKPSAEAKAAMRERFEEVRPGPDGRGAYVLMPGYPVSMTDAEVDVLVAERRVVRMAEAFADMDDCKTINDKLDRTTKLKEAVERLRGARSAQENTTEHRRGGAASTMQGEAGDEQASVRLAEGPSGDRSDPASPVSPAPAAPRAEPTREDVLAIISGEDSFTEDADNILALFAPVLAENAKLRQGVKNLDESIAAMEERDKWAHCACMCDRVDDICMLHSPAVAKAVQRAEQAESALATLRAKLEEAQDGCRKLTSEVNQLTTKLKSAPSGSGDFAQCARQVAYQCRIDAEHHVPVIEAVLRKHFPTPAVVSEKTGTITAEDVHEAITGLTDGLDCFAKIAAALNKRLAAPGVSEKPVAVPDETVLSAAMLRAWTFRNKDKDFNVHDSDARAAIAEFRRVNEGRGE